MVQERLGDEAPGLSVEGPKRRSPWRRAAVVGLSVWAVSRLGLLVVTLLAGYVDDYDDQDFGIALHQPTLNLFGVWDRLDANRFAGIGENGYTDSDSAAFFPLFPGLIKAVAYLTFGNTVLAGFIVANLAFIGALVVLHRLVEHEFAEATARRAGWLLVTFPTALFLGVGYNMSLFVLLAAGCWYAMRRERWWLAGALGGLAAATRSTGVVLTVPFIYEYLRQHRWRPSWRGAAVGLIPGGLGCVVALFWVVYGDPLAYVHAQRDGWGNRLDWPWAATIEAVRAWMSSPLKLGRNPSHDLLAIACVVLLLATSVAAFVGPLRFRRDQYGLALFAVAATILALSAHVTNKNLPLPLMSLPRRALEVFPVFIVLARIERDWFQRAYLFVALPVQGMLIAAYALDYWVE